MAGQFNGKIALDIRDSTPDWDAFLDQKAPKDAPNVLVILYDDTGCAAWSTYGGRINMPTLDRLASQRAHLLAVAHHLGLLADPLHDADGPQSPPERVRNHRRIRGRLSRLRRPYPARERDDRDGAA